MQFSQAHTLLFFITGGFFIFLAITITRDNFASRTNRSTGAMIFFAGLGLIAMSLGQIISSSGTAPATLNQRWFFNLYYLWELFFPTLLLFTWVFPVDRLRHFKHLRIRNLIFIPQILHVALMVSHRQLVDILSTLASNLQSDGFIGIILQPLSWIISQVLLLETYIWSNHGLLFGSVNLAYIAIAIYFLESGRLFLTNPRLLSQIKLVLWSERLGLGLYLISIITYKILQTDQGLFYSNNLLLAAVLLWGGFLTYAIVRHQFLNVQLVFRQSVIYTFASAILVGIYILIGMHAEEILAPFFGAQAEIVNYLLIILLLLLFQPVSHWLDNIIRSMFVRTRSDYRNIIERYSRQVISIFDPLQLRQMIEETLKTSLLIDHVIFVLFDDDVKEYAILKSDDYPRRTVINREDLMLRGINLLDNPTRYASLNDYEEGSKLAQTLNDIGVRVILPMKDSQHLLGFLALTSRAAGYRYTAEDFNLLGVLSNQMVTAMTNARLYADSLERLRLEEEVNMARQIQVGLLPSEPPKLECSTIAASSTPSLTVGGDFYDFIPIISKNRCGIVIADASGKGMPAALMIAQTQAIIRSEINNGTPIATMMKNMNTQIALATSPEKYVTLFYGEIDMDSKKLYFANAGHNYPMLVRANGDVELLEVGGPIIGAFPYVDYESSSIQLYPDDHIFFYTDGLSEAMDHNGKEYGESRIKQFIVENRKHDSHKIMNDIIMDVRKFDPTSPPQDDTTIITLKMSNGSIINE